MFADSLTAMLFVAIAPEAWLAFAVIVAVAVAAQRRADVEESWVSPSWRTWR